MSDCLLLGLMSGTSMDAVDVALLRIGAHGFQLLDALEHPIPPLTQAAIFDLCHNGNGEIERMGPLDRELGELFAAACNSLLAQSGTQASQVRAIGSHGQTIRHHPPSSRRDAASFTLQIGDPNTIAELTGITTVADFRRRDIAAGGEGAPLAPAFHAAAFSDSEVARAIVNIGGIANITLLESPTVSGFDTGPGNTLLDLWIRRARNCNYDDGGAWAASGKVLKDVLQLLLSHEYFSIQPPKSTGKELFNLAWLDRQLQQLPAKERRAEDVQSTLAEFTAATICDNLPPSISEIYVCGGGAANSDLMARIQRRAAGMRLGTTAQLGIEPGWVEAAAFAWLANQCLEGLAGNLPGVTGAAGSRILGGIYPGRNPRES